jgi:acetyltransferase
MDALEQVLLRVSEMVCELPQLREMDINPIIVDESGAVAVDARIVIDHAAGPMARTHNYNHLAILPYPTRARARMADARRRQYTIRPIRPDDADMLQALVRGLSQESRYFRFASAMPELPPRMLARYTLIDYDREMALVAVHKERTAGTRRRDGRDRTHHRRVALHHQPRPDQLRVQLVVSDDFKGQGLGSRLMLSIMDAARAKGLAEIDGLVLANNPNMLRLMKSLDLRVPQARLVRFGLFSVEHSIPHVRCHCRKRACHVRDQERESSSGGIAPEVHRSGRPRGRTVPPVRRYPGFF